MPLAGGKLYMLFIRISYQYSKAPLSYLYSMAVASDGASISNNIKRKRSLLS